MNAEEKIIEEMETEVLEEISESKEDNFKAISLNELSSIPFPENKWVIKNLIPDENIAIISGAPASYKTWLILQMAISIAKGESLFSTFPCEKHNVLIIDEENHLRLLRDRLNLLGADNNLPIYILSQKGFLVSDPNLREKVLKICQEKEIDVIFIDSLVRINNAEENDASQMSEVFKCIRQLSQTGKTIIITHHERKEGAYGVSAQSRLRGSSDISASVDAHISIKRDKSEKNKIIIEQAKLREAEEMPRFDLAVTKIDNIVRFDYLGFHSEEANKKDLAKDVIMSVLEHQEEGLSIGDICKIVKENQSIGEKNTRKAIDELIKEKLLFDRQGDRNTKICYLPKYHKEIT